MREQAITLDRASLEGAGREILKNWWVVLCWMVAMLLGATGVGTFTIPRNTLPPPPWSYG